MIAWLLWGWISISRADALPVVLDFAVDDGSMEAAGDPGQWEWGVPGKGPDPGGAPVWATRLDRDAMHEADDTLRFPAYAWDAGARVVLGLTHAFSMGAGDAGTVELWTDGAWRPLAPVYGHDDPLGFVGESGGWRTDWFDLDGISDAGAVRLRFTSDARGSAAGWLVASARFADGDPVPPQITLGTTPTDTTELVGPYIVTASIIDDVAVSQAELVWVREGEGSRRVELVELAPGWWTGGIPGAAPGTSTVWWVEATDGTNTASTEAASFRVYLPAPTGLVGPSGRVVDTHATLTWMAPESVFSVERYRVWRGDLLVAETTAPIVEAPLAGPVDLFTVSARFLTPSGLFEGDRSGGVQVRASVPVVEAVSPDLAWQGDALHLRVSGLNLLLVDDDVELDLGQGIHITAITVLDVDHLEADLAIDADAPPGLRDLWLRSGGVRLQHAGALLIEDSAQKPQISMLTPNQLVPGESAVLRMRLSRPLAGPALRVDLGEGVVVGAVRAIGDPAAPTALDVELTVLPDAVLGERSPTIDDGERLWSGARLRVRAPDPDAARVCSAAGTPFSQGLLLTLASMCAGLLRRRRRT